jgi:hypothetical protein
MALSYFAAWTDSGCLLGCSHQHQTIASAVPCIASAGGYVIAVEDGEWRELTSKEEAEFRYAIYGVQTQEQRRRATVIPMLPAKWLLN